MELELRMLNFIQKEIFRRSLESFPFRKFWGETFPHFYMEKKVDDKRKVFSLHN